MHLANGWILALFYAIAPQAWGGATWWRGAVLGLVHAAVVLTVAMPILPGLHPRMASEQQGPDAGRLLEPPGFLGLHYGWQTPLWLTAGHVLYGLVLGHFLPRHRPRGRRPSRSGSRARVTRPRRSLPFGRGTAGGRGELRRGSRMADAGPRTRRRGPPRWLVVTAAIVLAIAGALRFALNPILEAHVRDVLSQMKGMSVTFADLSVSVFRLSGEITDLKVEKRSSAVARGKPLFFVRRMSAGLYWRELLHGHVVAKAELDHPKVNLIAAHEKSRQQTEVPDLAEKLKKLAPFKLDRIAIKDGELTFTDATEPEQAQLWLHGVQATVENFATRPALQRGSPTVLALSGTLQRTGRVSVFASADPLAKGLTFAGQARLAGLHLTELASFMAARSGLEPARGTIDLSARFEAQDGRITGALRPVLKAPGVKAKNGAGIFKRLEAAIADSALEVFSDRVPSRDAVATTLPIRGEVKDPKAQVWPTVFALLRNAFVTGVTDSVAGLAPHAQASR